MAVQLKTLVSFNGADGEFPFGGLITDAKGDLFGTTSGGGADGDGTAFEIANTGTFCHPVYASAPTTLVTFNGANGSSPESALIADAKGDLFGTTVSGGASDYGTAFEIANTGSVSHRSMRAAPKLSSTSTARTAAPRLAA